jgi:hypothetical protein
MVSLSASLCLPLCLSGKICGRDCPQTENFTQSADESGHEEDVEKKKPQIRILPQRHRDTEGRGGKRQMGVRMQKRVRDGGCCLFP